MTLTKLTVRDFQGHREFTLPLGPGVTTIVGPTDAGKSTLLRAIRWVSQNKIAEPRPRKVRLVRRGADVAKAALVVDGTRVVRQQGKGVNSYRVGKRALKAFGTAPPRDVSDLLNVGDLNFQSQSDRGFWFVMPPSQVSKELNRIVDLSVIDRALSHLAKEAHRARAEARVVDGRLAEGRARAEGLRWVRDARAALECLEVLEATVARGDARTSGLASAVKEGRTLAGRVERLTTGLQCVDEAVRCAVRSSETTALVFELGGLVRLGRGYARKARAVVPKLDDAAAWSAARDRAAKEARGLADLVQRGYSFGAKVDVAGRRAAKLEADFHEALAGKVCPLCDQEVKR